MKWLRRRFAQPALEALTDMTARALTAEDRAEELARENEHLRSLEASTRKLLTDLIEPPPVGDCIKVRLRSRDEAEAFARRVERESGAEPGTMEAVQCKRCPRQIISSERFWHIRHVRPSQRNRNGAQYARTRPRELGRISPADIARIRNRVEGAA
ncbi:hypothetical protein ABZ215_33495 [Amycolatopsis sp. NPDC006131]|uniref:hypothetical protein n=1 Tax=Amycolatopsis sp. NPDC006131 TaxID=3156731 RepID=UPI0033BF52D9